jgi:dUTP pyrophosphatase
MNCDIHIVGNDLPEYATEGSAGFDIKSAMDVVIPAGLSRIVQTGLRVAIPDGFEMQIRSRSGLASKHSVIVANAPGTIDSDYRGEIGVILINLGKEDYRVAKGDRIAQGVICPVYRANWINVLVLPETDRGAGGFGSTGR